MKFKKSRKDLIRDITGEVDVPLLVDDGELYQIVGVDQTSVTYIERVEGHPINRYLQYLDEFAGWVKVDHPGFGNQRASGFNTVNVMVCDAINDLLSGDRDLTLIATDKPIRLMAVHRDDAEFIAGQGGYHFFTIYNDKSLEVDYHFTIPDLTEADVTAFTQNLGGVVHTVIMFLYDDDTSLKNTLGTHIGDDYVAVVEDILDGDKFNAYQEFDKDHKLIFLFKEQIVEDKLHYETYFNPAPMLPAIGKDLDGWTTTC